MNSSELVSLDAVWLGCCEYSSSCFHCRNDFISSASLLTSLIYPCRSAGGTVRAFTLASYSSPRLIMPSADSRIRDGLASRLAHSADPSALAPACSCSPWARRWLGRIAPYPLGYGAYLYVDPRFCLRLPSGTHCCYTFAFGYPSPPSGWVWTLPDVCVILSDITI